MNLYKAMNEKQIKLLKEADVEIENREYKNEEVARLQNEITSYIFSKSKKEIGQEVNKFSSILDIIKV